MLIKLEKIKVKIAKMQNRGKSIGSAERMNSMHEKPITTPMLSTGMHSKIQTINSQNNRNAFQSTGEFSEF